MVRFRVHVTGKVQGVFYRASTREQAQTLGLTGWVMNQRDGSVLFEAQGQQSDVEKMIEWSKHGPRFASVSDVRVESVELQEDKGFEIRY